MNSVNTYKHRNKLFVLLCLVAVIACMSYICISTAQAAGNLSQTELAAVVTSDYAADKPAYDNIVFWSLIFAGSIVGLIAVGINSLKVHRW